MPNSTCSRSYQPAPTPRMSRPLERMSTAAAIRANSAGGRNVIGLTIGPISIRFVHSAASASDVHHREEVVAATQRGEAERLDVMAETAPAIPVEPFLALDHDPELRH